MAFKQLTNEEKVELLGDMHLRGFVGYPDSTDKEDEAEAWEKLYPYMNHMIGTYNNVKDGKSEITPDRKEAVLAHLTQMLDLCSKAFNSPKS